MSPKLKGPIFPEGQTLAEFNDYRAAVSYVEKMIENEFPPKFVSIVGTDLRTVESIKGKLGYGRVAFSGMLTGSWLGMFFGLLFGTSGASEQVLLTNVAAGIVIGAGIGMLLNVIRFSLTKNRRAFISGQQVIAKKYEVVVPVDQLELAKKAAAVKNPVKPVAKKSTSKKTS